MTHGRLILDRYRPMIEAGAGGFGTVWVAWDTRIQRKVAIKCIELNEAEAAGMQAVDGLPDVAYAADADAQAHAVDGVPVPADAPEPFGEFSAEPSGEPFTPQHSLANIPGLDEARTAAMLTDANIVGVYDFEVQGNTAYLIMEYVEGITLTRFLREYDVSLDIVAAVFSSVAHALEVAHANQVLHLDIKPDNVLINRQGQVKVTDFGLATLADASGCGTTGGGTIGYMPLEQMRQESLDARCDEWALASLTYEMLTERNPFLAPNLERAEAAIEDAELVLPSLCWDDADEDIDDVLFCALDPDRDERYDSVADFAQALKPHLGDVTAGEKELAALVGHAQSDSASEAEKPSVAHVPWAERISDRAAGVIARAFAVASAVLVGVVAAVNLPWVNSWDSVLLWGLVAVCAAAAAIKPHVGALAGFAFLGVSIVCNGAFLLGAALIAATVVWWWFVGRGGNRQACAALAQPLFGAVGLAPVAPVMAGCFLGVRDAVITAAYSVVTAFALSGYAAAGAVRGLAPWNTHDVMSAWSVPGALPNDFWVSRFPGVDLNGGLVALTSLDAWCVAASWVLAALVFSLFCLRGTKAFDVAGAVLACVVLVAGACLAVMFAVQYGAVLPADASFQTLLPSYLTGAIVAGAAGIAAAACGVSDRVRWEDAQEDK